MESSLNNAEKKVWVRRDYLHSFFSCDINNINNSIDTSPYVLEQKSLICRHGKGLHPCVANNGKLISQSLFENIMELQSSFNKFMGIDKVTTYDCIICQQHDINLSPTTQQFNIKCQECSDEFQRTIKIRVKYCKNLLHLYEELMGTSSSKMIKNETNYRVPHSFLKIFAKYVFLVIQKINSVNGLGNINEKEWLKVSECVDEESLPERDTDEHEEKKDKVVDSKTWELISVMFPNVVEEQTIKTTLRVRDFSIQGKRSHNVKTIFSKQKEKTIQSSNKSLMTFPFKATNYQLIMAADNLGEASEVCFDESKKESIQDSIHKKKYAHTTATISHNELSRLKVQDAYLNDSLIDFWMLW